jgi:hypothetical protein
MLEKEEIFRWNCNERSTDVHECFFTLPLLPLFFYKFLILTFPFAISKITEPHKEEAKARYGLQRHIRRRKKVLYR